VNVMLATRRREIANRQFVKRVRNSQKKRSLRAADIFIGLAAAILSLLFEHHDTLSASHNTNRAALRVSIPIGGLPDTRVISVTAHGARFRSNLDGRMQFRRFARRTESLCLPAHYIRFVTRAPAGDLQRA
jgi:hypothetical protein